MEHNNVRERNLNTRRCRTSNIRDNVRCATGDGCPHLTTEHGHSMSCRWFNPRDKDRHSPCAFAILRLELMPDIILYRDCTAVILFSLSFYCFIRLPLWCRSEKYGIFDYDVVLWLSCVSGRPFSSDACLSLVSQLELLAKINVWQRDIRVNPEKSPLCCAPDMPSWRQPTRVRLSYGLPLKTCSTVCLNSICRKEICCR